MITVGNVKFLMKYVDTFGTGRHKRQADITLLFQYIWAELSYEIWAEMSYININMVPVVLGRVLCGPSWFWAELFVMHQSFATKFPKGE